MNTNNALIIFLKYPQPGAVKTRLAKYIGKEKACLVYKGFVEKILQSTNSVEYDKIIFFSPTGKKEDVKEWLPRENIFKEQKGRDLGKRIFNAFKETFSLGYRKAIVMGTDTVSIDNTLVEKAFGYINGGDIVIGPSKDGGYYLIGMACLNKNIFCNIKWSTNSVLTTTIDRLEELDINYYLLEEKQDIDTYDDFKNLGYV